MADTRILPARGRTSGRDSARPAPQGDFVPFRVSWGGAHGADARRLVAMLCRRGNIRGADVGAIRVAPTHSVVEVASAVAQSFERATREPDPRDPRVHVSREREPAGARAKPGAAAARTKGFVRKGGNDSPKRRR